MSENWYFLYFVQFGGLLQQNKSHIFIYIEKKRNESWVLPHSIHKN